MQADAGLGYVVSAAQHGIANSLLMDRDGKRDGMLLPTFATARSRRTQADSNRSGHALYCGHFQRPRSWNIRDALKRVPGRDFRYRVRHSCLRTFPRGSSI